MLHFDRTWCVASVETPQELAEKLMLMRWCCCMAFQIEGHPNCFWLNDSESPEATQEYAAIVEIGPNGKRVEIRYPDAASNPYLAFSAMLMAGLDGIENRIHPGDPIDKNLYDLPPEELKGVPTVCGSLGEALDALSEDRAFLTKGDVFTDSQIDGYIELKREEVTRLEMAPHPIEFSMYYST